MAGKHKKKAGPLAAVNPTVLLGFLMYETVPVRPGFWNVPFWAEIGIYLLAAVTVAVCAAGVIRTIKNHRAAPPDASRGAFCLKGFLKEVFGQSKVSQTGPGKTHVAMFWGFILLFLGTATATLDWDVGHYLFDRQFLQGWVYLGFKLILDIAGAAVLLGLAVAAVRRYALHDARVEADGRFACILASLAAIVLTGFLTEALRLAVQAPEWRVFSPVGNALSLLLSGADADTLKTLHTFVWVIHGLASLSFIAALPLTYYSHLFKTPLSIASRKTAPAGAIPKIENIEEQESFGISRFEQFSTLDRTRLDGCTECGRCRSVCPAVKAATPLDPKRLVTSLKIRLNSPADSRDLIGGIIEKDALWSCTTCGACARVCPADIPIPDMVVAMRRHLALEEGEFPEGLAGSLENTASVGNPWGMDPGSRLAWAKGLDVPRAKTGEDYDILYWVGCSASYDKRAQKIARAMVKILKAAGVKFAVMAEERCHADFARRAGEEYLFQTAAAENIENLAKYRFKRLLAACPHCFNTFKNEYPQFEGGRFDVVDHASFIEELITSGRLSPEKRDAESLAYHDPCYLARYNGITEAPRRILAALGIRVFAPAASGEATNCCGAGGAQIFMDRPARINVIRLKELKAADGCGAASACPHCMTMLTSAAAQATKPGEAPYALKDIAELVADRLPDTPPAA